LIARNGIFPNSTRPHLDLYSTEYMRSMSLPDLGNGGRGMRDESRVEQFARQVHREGLPVARLWENDNALVSLGLNTHGKPGLWILQKTR
jgi:hypothetical protein